MRKVITLKTAADFSAYLDSIGVSLPFDETVQSGLNSSFLIAEDKVGCHGKFTPSDALPWPGHQ